MEKLEYIKHQLCDLEKMSESYPSLHYFITMAAIDASELLTSVRKGHVKLRPADSDQGDHCPK